MFVVAQGSYFRFFGYFVLLSVLGQTVTGIVAADELYLLRVEAPGQVAPGELISVSIVADCVNYPDPSASVPGVTGFGFTLHLPSGVELNGCSWGESVPQPVYGLYDWTSTPSGTSVGASGLVTAAIANGFHRELLRLDLQVSSLITPGEVLAIDFDLEPDPPVYHTPGGALHPHLRSASIAVVTAGAGLSGLGLEPESEIVPAPGELTIDWIDPLPAGEGGGTFLGGGSYPSANAYCQYEAKGDVLPIGNCPNPTGGYDCLVVSYATMQWLNWTVAAAIASGSPTVVVVPPGTYQGTLGIDVTGLQSHVIIATEHGPGAGGAGGIYDTILDGSTAGPGAFAEGPTVIIHGNATHPDARLSFGWHEQEDINPISPAVALDFDARGWRGFQVTGAFQAAGRWSPYGANILIRGRVEGGIEIRGNWIRLNQAGTNPFVPVAGGGIRIDTSTGAGNPPLDSIVQVISNDISECQAGSLGGGIAATECGNGRITIARNYVHDCFFSVSSVWQRNGGGIYAKATAVDLCRNYIYANRAVQGCGVYMEYDDPAWDPTTQIVFYVEENEIHSNYPDPPGPSFDHLGGGVAISGGVSQNDNWQLGLVRNRIHSNGLNETSFFRVETGGGVDIDVGFASGLGPFGILDPLNEQLGQLFVGNAIYLNKAESGGAGVRFAASATSCAPDPCPRFRFWANTIVENEQLSGDGYGLLVEASAGAGTDVSSCIIQDHDEPGTDDRDWYADIGSQFDLLEYTFAPDCNALSPEDLVPAAGWSVATIDLLQGGDDSIYCRQEPGSPTVDAGEPAVGAAMSPHPRLDTDFDGEPRVVVDMDSGADEYMGNMPFRRGDANHDGWTDASDSVAILNALFVPGTPPLICVKAGDTNDDSYFDISDSVYLLAWLFAGGSPPPAPFPFCGSDPSVDILTCVSFPSCP